jgi:[acyl-carrier-protein] S-malonyltransferase
MQPAAERLAKALASIEVRDVSQPVVANVDGRAHRGVAPWAELLEQQLVRPVRWRQSLHTLADLGVSTLIELGPGTVLTGLAKRTLPGSRTLAVNEPGHLDALLELLASPSVGPVGLHPHEGEHLFATERLVVSPSAGDFAPQPELAPGVELTAGAVVGRVNGATVHSPFAGIVVGVLAMAGERLSPSQPIAWLRTA